MSTFSDVYSGVYDVLYGDKNYEMECDYLRTAFANHGSRPVKHVLDLGCGTGGHSIPLARTGFQVMGVDRAPKMIDIARQKARSAGVDPHVTFHEGDLVTFSAGAQFDAIICLFSVLCYQTHNEGLLEALRNVRRHLRPDGIFICDFWYGPTVLQHPPTERFKILETNDNTRVIRLSRPALDANRNLVVVQYQLLMLRENTVVGEATESHAIRYFFQPELEALFSQAGLKIREFHPSFCQSISPTPNDWNVMVQATCAL